MEEETLIVRGRGGCCCSRDGDARRPCPPLPGTGVGSPSSEEKSVGVRVERARSWGRALLAVLALRLRSWRDAALTDAVSDPSNVELIVPRGEGGTTPMVTLGLTETLSESTPRAEAMMEGIGNGGGSAVKGDVGLEEDEFLLWDGLVNFERKPGAMIV